MPVTDQQRLPAYDHRGAPGTTLVFLHYWGGSGRTWAAVADRLADRDVLTLDFRGWGRSADLPGPYGLRQLADDTLAVLGDAGVGDFVLVGHSMGAKVAQLVAATRPAGLRGLVLVAPAPAKPPAALTSGDQERLSHAYDDPRAVAQARDHVLTATALPEELQAQVVADSRASADAARAEWPLHGIAEDVSDRTRLVDVPTLVVTAEHDRVEPAAVLREGLLPHLADVEVVEIPGSGHLVPLEAPAALAEAIRAFGPALGA